MVFKTYKEKKTTINHKKEEEEEEEVNDFSDFGAQILQLCDQESLLIVLSGPYAVLEIEWTQVNCMQSKSPSSSIIFQAHLFSKYLKIQNKTEKNGLRKEKFIFLVKR